ncbi:glycosyltransferase [Rhizorhapis sp. SPR117]|uniref:glycosyltransferase n=1 Tax=Rhizorhapis sp. SPR117 TaxID=2912611 RepID=UPI001F3A0FB4|nr:glycosyltransferase [Rhizorhapis sp. SPR117]
MAAQSRKKALFVINSLAGGGAERVMTTLLCASDHWRDRYDMSLALLDREAVAYTTPDWLETIQFDCRGGLLPSILALRRLVSRLRPDVTLSFLTRANVANVLATSGRDAACIISERVNSSAHLGEGIRAFSGKALVRATYPRARHVIAVSNGVAQDLTQNFSVRSTNISVISNPVDHELIARMGAELPGLAITGEYIVAAGRLVPNKNFNMLIDAFARSDLPGSLVILGEGPMREALEAQVRQLGLADRVCLPGFIDNPFAVLKRASLFALSSNAEGFPNGLVEALACGLPVVATNCASGPAEILLNRRRETIHGIVHGPAGAVVPPNNPSAFATALCAIHDPAMREARGAAAIELSRKFSVERTTDRYWEIIENATTSRPKAVASRAEAHLAAASKRLS